MKAKDIALTISEAQFARQVIELAQYTGWRVAHFRQARVIIKGKETWRTPLQGGAEGYPDLTLARKDRLIFAELKSEKGKLTWEQASWVDALRETGKCEVYTWRPSDWDAIEATLK